MATKPTYEQAKLQLKLFDLRRETRLRQARDWFSKNYFANTLDEAMAIAPMGTEAGTSYMMVVSYWTRHVRTSIMGYCMKIFLRNQRRVLLRLGAGEADRTGKSPAILESAVPRQPGEGREAL